LIADQDTHGALATKYGITVDNIENWNKGKIGALSTPIAVIGDSAEYLQVTATSTSLQIEDQVLNYWDFKIRVCQIVATRSNRTLVLPQNAHVLDTTSPTTSIASVSG
jgi:hypothetical protein